MNSMSMKYKFAELITSRHHQGELQTNRRILRSRYNYVGGNYSREIISGGLAILVRMFNIEEDPIQEVLLPRHPWVSFPVYYSIKI